jgi:hypothetical protein
MYYIDSTFWSVMVTLKKNPIGLEVLPSIFGSSFFNLVPIEQNRCQIIKYSGLSHISSYR